eukprot:CAMPEP_0205869620 /NCGR_PEP_ID=MMETSP1083-20121108/10112_1 /ASSEMBLY_ACC=CAM_ASM_000430 /TAXON_ID=97485 /ORGANISM="Prymnesium parvum, Strain Texoma1" /LENGTH=294 /DNA_ID=CAMNT_0053231827 /DNA_START=549 /DNA_END=1433 /DNA_ORIENTATION=+
MFSGLPCKSSLAASIFFSFSSHAASISSSRTHVTEGDAATCMAMAFASSWNSGRLATKSVSQLTSTITPSFEPVWMYVSMIPSLAARPAFLSAEARPFWRSISVALSMSPSCSSSAFLQSIIPAPVMSRRVFTVLASTVACIATSARPAGTRDRDTTAPEARRTAAAGTRKAKRAARSSGEARIGAASTAVSEAVKASTEVNKNAVAQLPDFSHVLPPDYRKNYAAWRSGQPQGAKGEVFDAVQQMAAMQDAMMNNTSEDFTEISVFRSGYSNWRRGGVSGAKSTFNSLTSEYS